MVEGPVDLKNLFGAFCATYMRYSFYRKQRLKFTLILSGFEIRSLRTLASTRDCLPAVLRAFEQCDRAHRDCRTDSLLRLRLVGHHPSPHFLR